MQIKRGDEKVRLSDIPEISKLSTPEKILLVEDLWDSIASHESAVPVPQSHMEELDKRLKKYESVPGDLLSLEELGATLKGGNQCKIKPGKALE
jgi:putative addiction module component (TIGR02574 family)